MNNIIHNILVADDEKGIRTACNRILTASGYNVIEACNGKEALELFKRQHNFSAAIIDLMMPDIDGFDLTMQFIQEDEHLIIIIITGNASIETAVRATKLGAYTYLPKPFKPEDLRSAIRNGLEKRALSIQAEELKAERENQLLELAFERSKCKSIINCMTDGVVVVNRYGKIALLNNAASRILPELAEINLPMDYEEAIKCEPLAALIGEMLNEDGEIQIRTVEYSFKELRYIVNATPCYDLCGDNLGVVAVIKDITALKKLNIVKSDFIILVANEVKTQLSPVEDFIQEAIKEMTNKDLYKERELLEKALSRSNTLNQMVEELIDITTIDNGNFFTKRSLLDIRRIVKEGFDTLKHRALEKNIDYNINMEDDLDNGNILADEKAIRIVIENLIDNALKYTGEQGKVLVEVKRDDYYMHISISDTGVGMSEDEALRCFDEFYRAHNQYTLDAPGAGLGLALTKRIVENHQGRLSLQTEKGKGCTFKVSIPRGIL